MTDCIFCDDYKKKLGVDLRTGCYHCFICEENGDFYKLYSIIENLTYFQAQTVLTYKVFLNESPKPKEYHQLIQSLSVQEEIQNFEPFGIELNPNADDLLSRAWTYLYERKLFDLVDSSKNTYYVARSGKFHERLILPYRYKEQILYFQGRSLSPNLKPKYLNPGSDHGIRSADILYPFELSEKYVVVCEGPVDALSLKLQGVNATCTTGCYMSNSQILALKQWRGKIIIGYDNDEAGNKGLKNVDRLRKKKCMPPIFAIHPPSDTKDFNEAHCKNYNLKEWIEQNTYEYNFENIMLQKL